MGRRQDSVEKGFLYDSASATIVVFDATVTPVVDEYELKKGDNAIIVETFDGAGTLILPPMGIAVGMGVFTIVAVHGATNAVAIVDKETRTDLIVGGLNADNEGAVLICDGRNWRLLTDAVVP